MAEIVAFSAPVFGCVLGILFAGTSMLMYFAFVRRPQSDPRAYLRKRKLSGKITVVCAGDSHTHASLSADYVGLLRERLGSDGYDFVNAGRNGNTSRDLLNRLPEIIHCEPDAVTLLIGTNDARKGFPEAAERYFEANLREIITRLRSKTRARIAFLSIPPLGEDFIGEFNRGVDRCNAVIRRVAKAHGVDYLAFNERSRALITESSDQQPRPFKLRPRLLLAAAFQHYVLRRNWNDIAARNDFVIHTDQIHLNDRASGVAASLIIEWLEGWYSNSAGSAIPRSNATTYARS